MSLLRCVILLQFAMPLALGQAAGNSKPASLPHQPEALVRSLYAEVVARHPIGIPYGADMRIFAPYLSEGLLHRIDLAIACGTDWSRQHPDPNLKPEIGWLESGLFSGDNERATPQTFRIERMQSEQDGSFRAYVRLTWGTTQEKQLIWRVAVVVVRANGHFLVDDVIYLKDDVRDTEGRLSEALSSGCDGPRWVGFGDKRNSLK